MNGNLGLFDKVPSRGRLPINVESFSWPMSKSPYIITLLKVTLVLTRLKLLKTVLLFATASDTVYGLITIHTNEFIQKQ